MVAQIRAGVVAKVFISYAREDEAVACSVYEWLMEAGHEVFLDHAPGADGIAVGEVWQPRLHERLRWADAMVCLLTSAYVNSVWCSAEVGIAQSRGTRLVPVRAEPAIQHPLLNSIQHLNLVGNDQGFRWILIDTLRRIDAEGGTGWPDDRSPFPGLRPFEGDQQRVFFSRSEEVADLVRLLRSPQERTDAAMLLVVGPSGCGKSSLVRAGLLPCMAREAGWWTVPPMLPGLDPVAALARELAAAARAVGVVVSTLEEMQQCLETDGLAAVADELLFAAPPPRRRRLLLVIDQFEEVVTQASAAQRARFTELLAPALRGPVQVVATLRPEFLDPLLLSPELAGLGTRLYPVRPLRRNALPEVIRKPAEVACIAIDDDLVTRLVADTDSGKALPLLAYTLAQLAGDARRGDRLSNIRYDELGGVRGTLTRQADAALQVAAAGRGREQVIRALLRLVTVDEDGHPTRWRVRRADLPDAVLTELDAFVARRLLVTDEDNGDSTIEIAHEAFLSAWAPLAQAIGQNAVALRARRGIERAAAEWADSGNPPTACGNGVNWPHR